MQLVKLGLCSFIVAISLYGCGGSGTSRSGSSGSGGVLTLNVDQMSPVPLVNGNPQNFYMYATNYGTTQLSNLSWNATLQGASSASTKSDVLAKVKSKLSDFVLHSNVKSQYETNLKPKDTTNPITIVDASQCTTIAAGGSCRIELQATAPGVVILNATSGSQEVVLEGGGGLIQADNYSSSYSGSPADTLTLSPISTISYGGSGGSYNFHIVNNGTLPVALSASSVGSLPANATLVFGNCPKDKHVRRV